MTPLTHTVALIDHQQSHFFLKLKRFYKVEGFLGGKNFFWSRQQHLRQLILCVIVFYDSFVDLLGYYAQLCSFPYGIP